jgi:1-acyl-sn-glycerol-3-phosphate acyltransferase
MPRAPEPDPPGAPGSDPPGAPELPAGLIGAASPRAGIAYRLLRVAWRLVGSALGLRITVEGLDALPRSADGSPAGGWVAAGIPHRTWIDPFLLWVALPVEPRLVFFGDARTMARSPLRRWVIRRVGGILPIPSHGGPRALATHLAAAAEVLRAGAVFCLFPEHGPPAPVDESRPVAAGLGYVSLRGQAPIVPVVLGGNHELYWGRRIVVRILPPLDARELAGLAPDAPLPAPGTRDERLAAHRIASAFRDLVTEPVAAAHRATEPPRGRRKRGRWLTTLFR